MRKISNVTENDRCGKPLGNNRSKMHQQYLNYKKLQQRTN